MLSGLNNTTGIPNIRVYIASSPRTIARAAQALATALTRCCPHADHPARGADRFGGTPEKAIDGKVNYLPNPFNRWTSYESPDATDWLEIDFGQEQTVGRVELYIYDDRAQGIQVYQ